MEQYLRDSFRLITCAFISGSVFVEESIVKGVKIILWPVTLVPQLWKQK